MIREIDSDKLSERKPEDEIEKRTIMAPETFEEMKSVNRISPTSIDPNISPESIINMLENQDELFSRVLSQLIDKLPESWTQEQISYFEKLYKDNIIKNTKRMAKKNDPLFYKFVNSINDSKTKEDIADAAREFCRGSSENVKVDKEFGEILTKEEIFSPESNVEQKIDKLINNFRDEELDQKVDGLINQFIEKYNARSTIRQSV
jgi:hypothetical protein